MDRRLSKTLVGLGALAALGLGGSAIAGAAGTSTTTAKTTSTATKRPPANFPKPGTAAHEALEKTVTGDAATKAGDAAVKSAGGGTVTKVTTDATGKGYEVTLKKSDGTTTEIHLDSAFTVQAGGPGGHGGPGGKPGVDPDPNDNDGPGTNYPGGTHP